MIKALVVLALLTISCHSSPPILPPGTAICTQPYFDAYCVVDPSDPNSLPLFRNGLACDLCQIAADPEADGCAWVGSGAPNLWCVHSCGLCSPPPLGTKVTPRPPGAKTAGAKKE